MLKSLRVEGFRCCRSTTLQFESPLAALIGKNGAGKTTILRAIDGLAFAASSVGQSRSAAMDFHHLEATVELEGLLYHYSARNPTPVDPPSLVAGPRAETVALIGSDGSAQQLFRRTNGEITIQ